jgi:hypothetical protein
LAHNTVQLVVSGLFRLVLSEPQLALLVLCVAALRITAEGPRELRAQLGLTLQAISHSDLGAHRYVRELLDH